MSLELPRSPAQFWNCAVCKDGMLLIVEMWQYSNRSAIHAATAAVIWRRENTELLFSAILEVHLSFVGERKLRIDSTWTRLLRFLPVFCSFCFSTTQIDTLEVLTERSSCKHLNLPASSTHFSISIGIIPIHGSPHSTYSHPSWEVSVLISRMVHKEARKERWC